VSKNTSRKNAKHLFRSAAAAAENMDNEMRRWGFLYL
jgi:hypothetical protein